MTIVHLVGVYTFGAPPPCFRRTPSYSGMLIDPFSVIARCHSNNIVMFG